MQMSRFDKLDCLSGALPNPYDIPATSKEATFQAGPDRATHLLDRALPLLRRAAANLDAVDDPRLRALLSAILDIYETEESLRR